MMDCRVALGACILFCSVRFRPALPAPIVVRAVCLCMLHYLRNLATFIQVLMSFDEWFFHLGCLHEESLQFNAHVSRQLFDGLFTSAQDFYHQHMIPNLHLKTTSPRSTKMKEIEHQILSLEERERKLAAHYGMVGDVDSVEVFDEAKRRAFAKLGPSFEDDLRAMNQLMFLRLQLTQLRH
ncbi:hypothetical protein EV421DRAFT_1798819 [Armillaria borealis]|uniref:Uncharacterized protein n=1 Tax=Armillaria borealis TaxID=47425 RepID=A0AA39JKZ2_9AGAR|nr:hypothetical protein EV421DRAFT_1798819 [Armillaria borealis]